MPDYYKRPAAVRIHMVLPRMWGGQNYGESNALQSHKTTELRASMCRMPCKQRGARPADAITCLEMYLAKTTHMQRNE